MLSGPKVSLISLGCPKNLVDSEVMLGKVAREGFAVGADVEDADVVVVNTCAFIEAAKQESIDAILKVAERKKKGRLAGVVATGCMAQRYPEELRKAIPELDAIVGLTAEDEMGAVIRRVLDALPEASGLRPQASGLGRGSPALKKLPMAKGPARKARAPITIVRDPSRPFGAEVGRLRLTPRHYAYLRVAEGCDHACTFCAIPSFRGRFRSKSEADVLAEARELARDGARELCLIAEDTNQFGQDRRDGSSLATLLPKLAAIDAVRWLRILYAYPAYFPPELVRAIADIPKVAKYLDLPLQHLADQVLRRMRRPSERQTLDLLERLRAEIPGLALRTTLIVGFPGETEADFEKLLHHVERLRFERLGVFCYSPEDGTPAFAMDGAVPKAVAERRRDQVLRAQQRISLETNRALVGREQDVLVEEVGEVDAIGRTYADAPEIDQTVRLTGAGTTPSPEPSPGGRGRSTLAPGDLVRARVTAADVYDLCAEVTAVVGAA